MAAAPDGRELEKAHKKIILSAGKKNFPEQIKALEKIRYEFLNNENQKIVPEEEARNLINFIFETSLYLLKEHNHELYSNIHKFFKRACNDDVYSLELKIFNNDGDDGGYLKFVKVNDSIQYMGKKGSVGPNKLYVYVKNYTPQTLIYDEMLLANLPSIVVNGKNNFFKIKSYLISFLSINSGNNIDKYHSEYKKFKNPEIR